MFHYIWFLFNRFFTSTLTKLPSQQKSLVLGSRFGQLALSTTSVPRPSPGEILIKVQSAAVNPAEWKIQKLGVHVNEFPMVLGFDLAGDVIEIGEGVTNVAVGDRVFLQADMKMEQGAFQQYAISPASLFAKIPPNLTYDEASTFPIALITAFIGLFKGDTEGLGLPNPLTDGPNKATGKTIVVLGGASSIGQFVIQLCKLSGVSTIITTASLRHTKWLKSLGATHVIDRNIPDLSAEVSKITGGQAIRYVYDAISVPETRQAGYDLLAPDGTITVVNGGENSIKNRVEGKKVCYVYCIARHPENREILTTFFDKITSVLAQGLIKPSPTQVLPNGLAGIQEGLERLEHKEVSGFKLVSRPQETA